MEKISWTDHVTNEEVLQRVKTDRNILQKTKRQTGLVTFCAETAFYNMLLNIGKDKSDGKTKNNL
jgi:hypothetical protein